MPRVLRILNRLAVGGPVLNAAYLTRYMPPEYQTLLVVGERESHEQSAEYLTRALGIECVTIPGMGRSLSPASDYRAYRALRDLMRSYRPHVVHTHAAKPGALGRLAAASARVPAIVHTFHGHVFHSYFNSVKTNFFLRTERYLAGKSDAIIAISEQQRRELCQEFRIAAEEKFRVIRLGLDLDRFRTGTDEKRRKFRAEFGLPDHTIAIGIIGRLVPVKNHYLFLKALAQLLARSAKPVQAFIIGDGETRADLEASARSYGIAFSTERDTSHPHPLVFTSWRSDVDTIMAGLDIITLTSFNEGTPVSLIEAQAAGRPILSTRVGGISDIVEEGATALLAGVDETDLFCSHLLRLVEDDNLRHRLGAGSSEGVMERFSYQRLVQDMDGLYRELLARKRSAHVAF